MLTGEGEVLIDLLIHLGASHSLVIFLIILHIVGVENHLGVTLSESEVVESAEEAEFSLDFSLLLIGESAILVEVGDALVGSGDVAIHRAPAAEVRIDIALGERRSCSVGKLRRNAVH